MIIKYSIKIHQEDIRSDLKSDVIPNRTGSPYKDTVPTFLYKREENPVDLTSGWDYSQQFTRSAGAIHMVNTTRIEEGRRVIPNLDGPSLQADNEVRIDSQEYLDVFGTGPRLGTITAGTGPVMRAFIFGRSKGRMYVEKEYKFVNHNSVQGGLSKDQFTEMFNDGAYTAVFDQVDPISICSMNGVEIDIDMVDYLSAAVDYNHIKDKFSMTEDNFFRSCEWIAAESTGVTEWDFAKFGMTLNTRYFPIYTKMSIIMKTFNRDTGEILHTQLETIEGSRIDSKSGSIVVDGSYIRLNPEMSLTGFYLFYGVVPSVYINSSDPSLPIISVLDDQSPLSYAAIDTSDLYGLFSIKEPTVHISIGARPSSSSTEVLVPLRYREFFVEPESTLMINGERIKGGERLWISNQYTNSIEIGPPIGLEDLLEPIEVDPHDPTLIKTRFDADELDSVSDTAAVYGIFRHGQVFRLSLAAASTQESYAVNQLISGAQGFGEGDYGVGAWSQGGFLPDGIASGNDGTVVNYVSTGPQVLPTASRVGINIKPTDTGYEIILPSWAIEDSIVIKEVGILNYKTFHNWKFINPDIIIIDKDFADPNTIYNIGFDISVYPVIPSIDIERGVITLIRDIPEIEEYAGYEGMLLLHTKQVKVKLGYQDINGRRSYLDRPINVNMMLHKEYLDRVITGTKTLII